MRKRCAEAADDMGSDLEEGLSGAVSCDDSPPQKKHKRTRPSKKAANPKGRPKAKAAARVSCKAKSKAKKDKVNVGKKRKEDQEDINKDLTGLPCMLHSR